MTIRPFHPWHRRACIGILIFLFTLRAFAASSTFKISIPDYEDRVQAVWTAQIAAVLLAWPHEHQVSSTLWLTNYPKPYTRAPVDDDWYYEMVAVRAFEKYGTGLTVKQLGAQWLENACGSWGSSEQAHLNLLRGIQPPDTGHPRYNKLWFTIGPQFSSDVYGALLPGMPVQAGRLARDFGHLNGYAVGTDGAVFMATMISLGFAGHDPHRIVREAARSLHPGSPYRQCLDMVIAMADAGKSFEEIVQAIEDRWHIEYPATNNAVPNGGIVAASLWFGAGDFLKTVNLAASAADFTDADCNAANAASVIGAMGGMRAIPAHLVSQLGDRIVGDKMGGLTLTPPVDESISDLAKRTAAIGRKLLAIHGAKERNGFLEIPTEKVRTQPLEKFDLADLMQYWNPAWTLERAGYGGAGGGMGGIRGITCLEGDILATYPRDEVRGALLKRRVKINPGDSIRFDAGVDAGRAWQLEIYADNTLLLKTIVESTGKERVWKPIVVDLATYAGKTVTLRLYQRVLLPGKTAGNALWRNLRLQ